ncbi:MAG: hypothetical protein JWN43_101, partial [Gammaproteobacteria bacterium]|nr:hypothetical protein [Gammaproteobacteria bacterium]
AEVRCYTYMHWWYDRNDGIGAPVLSIEQHDLSS